MANHTIELNFLIDYQSTEKVLYASSSTEKKKLYITLRGSYEVWHKGELILETIQPFMAVEKYNEIEK